MLRHRTCRITEKPELTQPVKHTTSLLILSPEGGVSRLHLGYHGHTVLVYSHFTKLASLPHDFFLHVVCFSHSSATGRLLAAFRLPSIGAYSTFYLKRIRGRSTSNSEFKERMYNRSNLHRSKTIFFSDGYAKNCPELAQLFCEPLQRNSSENGLVPSSIIHSSIHSSCRLFPYSTISITHRISELRRPGRLMFNSVSCVRRPEIMEVAGV